MPYYRCLDAVPNPDDEGTTDTTVDSAADDYDCPEFLDICCKNIGPELSIDELRGSTTVSDEQDE